jgi:hypothetical protein
MTEGSPMPPNIAPDDPKPAEPTEAKPTTKRCDMATERARVGMFVAKLLLCYGPAEFAIDPEVIAMGLSPRQIRRYLAKARKRILRIREKDEEELAAFHLTLRRRIAGQAIAQGDMPTALRAADSECRLAGLLDKKAGPHDNMTPEQTEAQMDHEVSVRANILFNQEFEERARQRGWMTHEEHQRYVDECVAVWSKLAGRPVTPPPRK